MTVDMPHALQRRLEEAEALNEQLRGLLAERDREIQRLRHQLTESRAALTDAASVLRAVRKPFDKP